MKSFLVVMAGGSGTRFWPRSTSKHPKQLLKFGSDQSLLRQTVHRFPKDSKMVVTTSALASAVEDDLGGLGVEVLAEPSGRNTAPCIYWAARRIQAEDPQACMLVMPADHHIENLRAFQNTVEKARAWASEHDDLVTLGVKPTRPETGYGYLKVGASLGTDCQKVERFVEKPSLDKAQQFLKAGSYLWNGGMFVWRVEVALKAFDQHMPEMKKIWNACQGKVEDAYPQLTATSVDFGIMEKASNVVTFPLDCGWDDLGSWVSLENLISPTEQNIISEGEVVAVNAKNNIVDAPGRLVALLGVNDLVVVNAGDSILVARKADAQKIRDVVQAVKKTRPELI